MANFGAKILNNAVSSLNAQQAVIANIGNNISNVNTEGYSRRVVDLSARAGSKEATGLAIGSGVQTDQVRRYSDKFLEQKLREAIGEEANWTVQDEMLDRIEGLFDLVGDNSTVGKTLTEFFSAVNDLRADPGSIELRSTLLERAEDVAYAINDTFSSLSNLQDEIDLRIENEIVTANSLTAQIADLNNSIAQVEVSGEIEASDYRDQRDKLLQDLAKIVSFQQVENSDGRVVLSLPNGFQLVTGSSSNEIEAVKAPSYFTNAPQSASGGVLSSIVYNYGDDVNRADLRLTDEIAGGEGLLAGLLRLRGVGDDGTTFDQATGIIPEVAGRIEAITEHLLTTVNNYHRGPDAALGVGGAGQQNIAGDLDGNQADVYGLFSISGVGIPDNNGDLLANDLGAGGLGLANYSSRIQVATADPRKIAAAQDFDTAGFTGSYAPGDGRNLAAIADLQSANLSFTWGTGSLNVTFEEVYNDAITYIGNEKGRTNVNRKLAEDKHITAANRRDEFSAVNLDEEFSNLIRYQQAYQASARMIRTASDLFDQILAMV